MVISMAIMTRIKTRSKVPPIGISQSNQSGFSVWGVSDTEPVGDDGGGSVVKALTALQALQVLELTALTFQ